MAVDVAIPSSEPARLRALSLARAGVSARTALAALVAVSVAVRSVLAAAHTTPYFFPDEYLYPELARSLADSGRPLVRGADAWFPALVEPLATAPIWLFADPLLALRLTQGLHVLAMSLAAVPVYLLARHLRLGSGFALGAAALALAAPGLLYAPFLLADPLGYPLVLTAVLLAVRTLDRPTVRAQAAFLVVAALAAGTRLQYAVLPVAFLAGALVVERGSVPRLLRSYRLTLLSLGVATAAAAAVGLRALGPYASGVESGAPLGDAVAWLGRDAMLLLYAAGWVLVPGALVALAAGLMRPRSRAEAGFAVVASVLTVSLLAGAALVAAHDSDRFQERYLFPLVPLLVLAFGLWARSERTRRMPAALVAAALVPLAGAVPVTTYVVGQSRVDSPFLWAVFRVTLEVPLADVALAISIGAVALSAVAAVLTFQPRLAAPVGLGLTAVVFLLIGVGGFSHEAKSSSIVRGKDLPADASWVDRTGLADVALVQTPGGSDRSALLQLYWNRSVSGVFTIAGAERPDNYETGTVQVGDDGVLRSHGEPLRRPVLFQQFATAATFADAERVAEGGSFALWRPREEARLSMLATGLYQDGWLAGQGAIFVWPTVGPGGTLELPLSMPAGTATMTLQVESGAWGERVTLDPGESSTLSVPLAGCGPWSVSYRAETPGRVGDGREVSLKSELPRHRPAAAAAACSDA